MSNNGEVYFKSVSENAAILYHANNIWVEFLDAGWCIKNWISIFSQDVGYKQTVLKGIIVYSEKQSWMPVKSLWSFENLALSPVSVCIEINLC